MSRRGRGGRAGGISDSLRIPLLIQERLPQPGSGRPAGTRIGADAKCQEQDHAMEVPK